MVDLFAKAEGDKIGCGEVIIYCIFIMKRGGMRHDKACMLVNQSPVGRMTGCELG